MNYMCFILKDKKKRKKRKLSNKSKKYIEKKKTSRKYNEFREVYIFGLTLTPA